MRDAMEFPQTLTIGTLKLDSPVLLAPMAGYVDLPFRLGVRSLGGVGLAYTEMLNPTSLIRTRTRKAREIIASCPEDSPLGFQIYGKEAAPLIEGARWLEEHGALLIDINMGCPQKKVVSHGSGSALLKTPAKAIDMAARVAQAVKIPVTVKIRLGWTENIAVELAREFEKVGVAAVTVHGRTRAQGFSGTADWDSIRHVVEAVRIPVIANGDVVSVETAREVFRRTGCAGIMVGRCALKEPWVLRDIARDLKGEAPLPPPTAEERVAFMLQHFDRGIELYGEQAAVLRYRAWIAQYIKGLAIPRPLLASLMQMRDAKEWRERMTAVLLGRTG